MSGHFEDRTLHCKGCDKGILIKHNQVGGFWHLSGWPNPHGVKFSGGYCAPCFIALDDILPEEKSNGEKKRQEL